MNQEYLIIINCSCCLAPWRILMKRLEMTAARPCMQETAFFQPKVSITLVVIKVSGTVVAITFSATGAGQAHMPLVIFITQTLSWGSLEITADRRSHIHFNQVRQQLTIVPEIVGVFFYRFLKISVTFCGTTKNVTPARLSIQVSSTYHYSCRLSSGELNYL